MPVYTALVRNGYRSIAFDWYNQKKTFYHPIAAANIRKIIYSTFSELEAFSAQMDLLEDDEYLLIE